MSANIDWSKFDPVEQEEQPKNQGFDWSQFEAVEQPQKKTERSLPEKAGRVATQYALGAAENALLPLELQAQVLKSPEAQNASYRELVGDDIERLLEQKSMGVWDKQDQELLDSLTKQIKDPSESQKFVKTGDFTVKGLAEKATGLNLEPEGVAEKAAQWAGFIKNPSKLLKAGLQPKEFIKAIAPSGEETLRGLGAGTALQMAEDGKFGPIGTMAAVIAGDLMGGGTASLAKGVAKLISQPKKTLAEAAAKLTPKDKLDLQKEVVKGFKDSGIQADLGTLTDSNLVKWTQSRLSQSGLTGKALEEFKHTLTNEIKEEYKALADSVGELKHATSHEAGEALKNTIKSIREADASIYRNLYSSATKGLKADAQVVSKRLADSIKNLENELKPGALKSGEQQVVLNAMNKLKYDVMDSSGNVMGAKVKDLMNNKIALNDIINYEVQGGAKQLLKGIVSELDRAIISHGKENPTFAKNYINANKKFSEHAKTFRGKEIDQVLKGQNPEQIMNKMNSVHGIKSIEKALNKSAEGKELFENLKRLKLQQEIGNNLIDSTTQQAKLGSFAKLLDKGKNRELFKELLPKESFKRLERLHNNAGKLADSYDKFYNASKSGVVAADAAIIFKVLADVGQMVSGNPWPLLKTGGGIITARQLSKLMADPEFLKLAEEAILQAKNPNPDKLASIIERLKPFILPLVKKTNENSQYPNKEPVQKQ